MHLTPTSETPPKSQAAGESQVNAPDRRYCILLTAVFAVAYGVLVTRQWVAGTPDSEYYLAIARNLAAGMGFVWNDQPVLMVPPAWPMLLAAAMKISTSMFFLNLVPYLCSLAGIALWYQVLTHLTTPRRACAVMLIFGILFNYHRFAQHFYSEALFVPLLAGTLLLALRIRRGPVRAWHVALMVALCCALVLVRWAGVFYWPVLAAACISWQPWRQQKGALVVAALSAVALLGTFVGTRKGLAVYARSKFQAQAQVPATALPQVELEAGDSDRRISDESPDLQWHAKRTKTAVTRAKQNWMRRLARAGYWLVELYWPPAQVAQSAKVFGAVANTLGWILWVLVLAGAIGRIRQGEWAWFGVLAFCLATVLFAGLRGRYLTPAAPLLLLALFQGVDVLRQSARSALMRQTGSGVLYLAIGSIVACNALIWGLDAWALHSSRFRQIWCGGDYAAMVDISDYLRHQDARDGQIAVSRYVNNFGVATASDASVRLVHLLTGRTVQSPPIKLSEPPPDAKLAQWAQNRGVRYYIYRPAITPWRLSHFRFPWLQEKKTGRPVTTWNPSFVLYELVNGQLLEVHVPESGAIVASVPGLDLLPDQMVRR